jgi:sugar lactone lactonase YvrE
MTESTTELPDLAEIVRIPSPAPHPQALAHDGESLWLGSWETGHFYGINPKNGNVFEQFPSPGKPVGATCVGDELRCVVSEGGDEDHRRIRRYVPGHGFKLRESIACPDDTGSFVACDGKRLWLSQRFNKRILELDSEGKPVRTIDAGEEILGLVWVGARLYISTWLGRERGGSHIAYIEPSLAAPQLNVVAHSPFAGVALAYDGERLWTNDFKDNAIVAFAIPA